MYGYKEWFMLQTANHTSGAGTGKAAGQCGVGSPRGLSKSTVVALTVVAVISVVYASCHVDTQVNVVITVPLAVNLSKSALLTCIKTLSRSFYFIY